MLILGENIRHGTFGGICNAAVQHHRICNPTMRQYGNYKLPDVWSGIANAAQPHSTALYPSRRIFLYQSPITINH